ncbi:MAG TPA: hypothetical protein EYH58_05325 [Aquifex aeolicus]|nr:hypothetical protein [Aquifex aeolicus]
MRRFLSFLLILIAIFGCEKKEGQSKGEKVYKVGALLPLTGNIGEYGERVRKGIELAKEEIKGLKLKIFYEDTQGVPRLGINGVKKLVEVDGVKYVIGAVSSSVTLAVEPITTKKKVLLFSPASSSPKLSEISPYFVRNWPSDDLEARAMALFAYKNLGVRNVVIFFVENDYGLGLKDTFKETLESLGGKVLGVERYPLNNVDFRTFISKYKDDFEKIDAFYVGGYHREMASFVKQLRELGYRGIVLTATNFSVPEAIKLAGKHAEGVYVSTPYIDFSKGKAKEFYEKFMKKYGYEPSQFEANGYDALMLIAEGIKKYGYENTLKVSEYIRSLKNYEGAGGIMSFTEEGNVIKPIAIKVVKNGKLELIKVFLPEDIRR